MEEFEASFVAFEVNSRASHACASTCNNETDSR